MKLPVVSRAKYEKAIADRDEWQQRAETVLTALEKLQEAATATIVPQPRRRRLPRWSSVVAAVWLLIIGLFIGVVVPKAPGPTLAGNNDLPACIGQARYEHPIKGNQYQELVNALYACKVYGGTS